MPIAKAAMFAKIINAATVTMTARADEDRSANREVVEPVVAKTQTARPNKYAMSQH
jgi:hypothetical protein